MGLNRSKVVCFIGKCWFLKGCGGCLELELIQVVSQTKPELTLSSSLFPGSFRLVYSSETTEPVPVFGYLAV